LDGKGEILAVSSDGSGWRVSDDLFPKQARYGSGVIGFKLAANSHLVGTAYGKKNHQVSVRFEKSAAKLIRIDEIPAGKRASAGKKMIEIKPKDRITGMVESRDFFDLSQLKLTAKPKKSIKKS